MMKFLGEHYLFLLTLVAAVLTFVASFTGLVSRNKPVLFLAVLLGLTFVVGLAYQTMNYLEDRDKARLAADEQLIKDAAQRARDNVISEIRLNVEETRTRVEAISARLQGISLGAIGTRLVSIQTRDDLEFEQSEAFAKGSPDMWYIFRDWISDDQGAEFVPSLSLSFGPDRYYDAGLLLVYLITTSDTSEFLEQIVQNGQWHEFPAAEHYIKAYSGAARHLRWVLFYQADEIVAFAEARAFARELAAHLSTGRGTEISDLLNTTEPLHQGLMAEFPSVRTAVFGTTAPSEFVADMIRQQIPIAVATEDNMPYVTRLEKMIRLALPDSP